jgi:hypothetical protein
MNAIESQAAQLAEASRLMQELAEIERVAMLEVEEAEAALRLAEMKVEQAKLELRDQLENFISEHPELKNYKVFAKGEKGVRSKPKARDDKLSVKDVILHGLSCDWEADRIVEAVRENFPDSKATKNDVAWYKGQVKKGRYTASSHEFLV